MGSDWATAAPQRKCMGLFNNGGWAPIFWPFK